MPRKETENIFHLLFDTPARFVVVAFSIAVFILFQLEQGTRLDDDLIGEQVYYFLKNGYVKSELMKGYGSLHLEQFQTIFHKLFIYYGALFTSIAGWSLTSLHLSVLLVFFLFLFLLAAWFRTLPDPDNQLFLPTACIMVVSFPILYFAGCFRPEVILMTLGFFCFFQMQQYLRYLRPGRLAVAATAAGLAFATHPHGLIFCVAGFATLLLSRKWKASLFYTIIAGVVFVVVYFADIFHYGKWNLLTEQFRNDPIIQVREHYWYSPLIQILSEHIRILYNERVISMTLLFAATLIFCWRYLIRIYGLLLRYLLFAFLTLGAISYSKAPQYLVLYLPFVFIIIVAGWRHLESQPYRRAEKYTVRLLVLAFTFIHLFFAGQTIVQNIRAFSFPSLAERNHQAAQSIPGHHARWEILANDNFIFNEIRNFRAIHGLSVYGFFAEQQGHPVHNLSALLASIQYQTIDYIVLDTVYQRYFNVTDSSLFRLQQQKRLEVIKHSPDVLILRPLTSQGIGKSLGMVLSAGALFPINESL